ncbi:unnamed protein product [Nesidiocoris tenuis]|uniref:Uncharacterized protein n=1 Tax=Nesidiocoris tenuis TaxID=355587 RepID=A0A6H5G4I7_9HEMI|nr:unnamed protein product [Nesidiocoris tenuis]
MHCNRPPKIENPIGASEKTGMALLLIQTKKTLNRSKWTDTSWRTIRSRSKFKILHQYLNSMTSTTLLNVLRGCFSCLFTGLGIYLHFKCSAPLVFFAFQVPSRAVLWTLSSSSQNLEVKNQAHDFSGGGPVRPSGLRRYPLLSVNSYGLKVVSTSRITLGYGQLPCVTEGRNLAETNTPVQKIWKRLRIEKRKLLCRPSFVWITVKGKPHVCGAGRVLTRGSPSPPGGTYRVPSARWAGERCNPARCTSHDTCRLSAGTYDNRIRNQASASFHMLQHPHCLLYEVIFVNTLVQILTLCRCCCWWQTVTDGEINAEDRVNGSIRIVLKSRIGTELQKKLFLIPTHSLRITSRTSVCALSRGRGGPCQSICEIRAKYRRDDRIFLLKFPSRKEDLPVGSFCQDLAVNELNVICPRASCQSKIHSNQRSHRTISSSEHQEENALKNRKTIPPGDAEIRARTQFRYNGTNKTAPAPSHDYYGVKCKDRRATKGWRISRFWPLPPLNPPLSQCTPRVRGQEPPLEVTPDFTCSAQCEPKWYSDLCSSQSTDGKGEERNRSKSSPLSQPAMKSIFHEKGGVPPVNFSIPYENSLNKECLSDQDQQSCLTRILDDSNTSMEVKTVQFSYRCNPPVPTSPAAAASVRALLRQNRPAERSVHRRRENGRRSVILMGPGGHRRRTLGDGGTGHEAGHADRMAVVAGPAHTVAIGTRGNFRIGTRAESARRVHESAGHTVAAATAAAAAASEAAGRAVEADDGRRRCRLVQIRIVHIKNAAPTHQEQKKTTKNTQPTSPRYTERRPRPKLEILNRFLPDRCVEIK